MKMFFLTPSGALALPANRSDSEFAGAGLARILLMLALLLSNWKAYAAIGVSSIAPTSAAEIKISSCGVDVTGTAKDYYNNTLPWGVAGTLNTAIDVATGIGHMPAAIGHLGEGTGTFSADPSWRNAGGVVSDALVVGSVLSATASALPSLNGSAAAAATQKNTTVYRAVKPEELTDVQRTGQLINRGSAEGKYFTSSAEDAAAYAKKAVSAFNDPPYTIIKTEVPTALLPKPVSVDGGIPAYVLPNEALPGLTPQVMPAMPIPGVR